MLTLAGNSPNINCLDCISEKLLQGTLLTGRVKGQIQSLTAQLLSRTESVQNVDISQVRLLQKIRGRNGKEEQRDVIGVKLRHYTGRAALVLPTGRRISSEWVQGEPVGMTRISYPAGFTYHGPLLDYKRHGVGQIVFEGGWRYYGQFEQGNMHGQGVLFDPEGGVVFSGEWLKNQPIEE